MTAAYYTDYSSLLTAEGLVYQVRYNPASTTEQIAIDRSGLTNLSSNYRIHFMALCVAYLAAGQTDSAKVVYNKALSLFPESILPYDYVMMYFVEIALKLHDVQSAINIAQKSLTHLKETPDYIKSRPVLVSDAEHYPCKELHELLKQFPNK